MTLRDIYEEAKARVKVRGRDAAYFLRHGESRYSSLPQNSGTTGEFSSVDLENTDSWTDDVELDPKTLE